MPRRGTHAHSPTATERAGKLQILTYLSSILGELKVSRWDHIGIIVLKVEGYLLYY